MEIALRPAVVFIEIAAASDLRPNIRNNCIRKQDRARHIVCLDCFNFKIVEVPPLTVVRRKKKQKTKRKALFGNILF